MRAAYLVHPRDLAGPQEHGRGVLDRTRAPRGDALAMPATPARSRTLAVIAARGGSQGIPRKNLIDVCGKPLLAWTIEHAKATSGIDLVAVSSDSDEILATA